MLKFNDFFNSYLNALTSSLKNTDTNQIYKSAKLILDTIKKNKKIFVCGNGGSTAISNHYICDYLKFFREHTKLKPQIYSLSTNIETVTAISNDINYDQIVDVKLERGMLSAAIQINVPGSFEDARIDALPKDDAEQILRFMADGIKQAKREAINRYENNEPHKQ